MATKRNTGARPARRAAPSGAAPAARGAALARLWAPWCMAYIRRADARDLVLARRDHAVLLLNRFPYNPAHLMVAVNRHAARFTDLGEAERADLLELTALAERSLAAEYRPHGINYGLNVGRVAGAGFPGHLHLHLVPRWDGDTNFMPTVAETKVLPESLAQTWRRLRAAIAADGVSRPRRRGGRRGA